MTRRFATVLVLALGMVLLMRSIVSVAAPVPVSAELYDFGIRLSPQTIAAGDVVFTVRNTSQNAVHEMVVAATSLAPDQLPYQARSNRVEEKKRPKPRGSVGSTSRGIWSFGAPHEAGNLCVLLQRARPLQGRDGHRVYRHAVMSEVRRTARSSDLREERGVTVNIPVGM